MTSNVRGGDRMSRPRPRAAPLALSSVVALRSLIYRSENNTDKIPLRSFWLQNRRKLSRNCISQRFSADSVFIVVAFAGQWQSHDAAASSPPPSPCRRQPASTSDSCSPDSAAESDRIRYGARARGVRMAFLFHLGGTQM